MPWVTHVSPEVNESSQYPAIIAVSLSLTAMMAACVAVRTYVRAAIVKSLGSDDYIIWVSAIISIVYNGLAVWQTRLGLGLPLNLRPEADLATYSVVNFTGRPLYMIVITGYKIAVCLGYLRLLGRAMPVMQKIVKTILVFVIISHIVDTLIIILQCRPIAKSWNTTLQGSCLANYPTWNATAAITIVCDITIFLLPVPLFAGLHIDIRKKISLIFVFVLGIFTTLCSVMRMVQIQQVAKDGNNSSLVLWGTAEMNVGIMLSCVPSLRPLLRAWAPSTSGYTKSRERTDGTRAGGAIRLKTMADHDGVGAADFAKPHHGEEDAGSEDNILPSFDISAQDSQQQIRKTVDVHITTSDGETSGPAIAFPSPKVSVTTRSPY